MTHGPRQPGPESRGKRSRSEAPVDVYSLLRKMAHFIDFYSGFTCGFPHENGDFLWQTDGLPEDHYPNFN